MQSWKEPTNLFIDGWCRSSIPLYPLASATPSKDDPAIKTKNTTHACYCSTRGLEIKHKSNKTHKNRALGWEKYSLLISR